MSDAPPTPVMTEEQQQEQQAEAPPPPPPPPAHTGPGLDEIAAGVILGGTLLAAVGNALEDRTATAYGQGSVEGGNKMLSGNPSGQSLLTEIGLGVQPTPGLGSGPQAPQPGLTGMTMRLA